MSARPSTEQPVFSQLYVNTDPQKSKAFIQRAEAAGASAIWLTVDSAVVGKREKDERLKIPFADGGEEVQGVAKKDGPSISASLDWDVLTWIRGITKLLTVINGIQCVEDALHSMASGHGEAGVQRMIGILRDELEANMALVGASSIPGIEVGMVNEMRLGREMFGGVKLYGGERKGEFG